MTQSVQDLIPIIRECSFTLGFALGAVFVALCVIIWRQS